MMLTNVPDPELMVPRSHRAMPFSLVQDPCPALADTNVVPAGTRLVTTTAVAAEGPRFVTVIAYVTALLIATGSGESLSVTARSATTVTTVTMEDALFVPTES